MNSLVGISFFLLCIMLVHRLWSGHIGNILSLGPSALWTIFPNMSGSQPMYYINIWQGWTMAHFCTHLCCRQTILNSQINFSTGHFLKKKKTRTKKCIIPGLGVLSETEQWKNPLLSIFHFGYWQKNLKKWSFEARSSNHSGIFQSWSCAPF